MKMSTDVGRIEDAAVLDHILDDFDERPATVRRVLDEWYSSDAVQLARAGVQHLGRRPGGAAEQELARYLVRKGVYLRFLLNPAVLTAEEALTAAVFLSHTDPRFFPRLVAACEGDDSTDMVMRAMDIVVALNRAAVVMPWVQGLSAHSNIRVQSRASRIFCGVYANPTLVERQLRSPDHRIRANSVEALWKADNLAARDILQRAASDRHHRVAVNAMLGLYFLHVPGAAESLRRHASHVLPQFRASTAWAMGQTGDEAFRCHLAALASDREPKVRNAARRALERLQNGAATSAPREQCP